MNKDYYMKVFKVYPISSWDSHNQPKALSSRLCGCPLTPELHITSQVCHLALFRSPWTFFSHGHLSKTACFKPHHLYINYKACNLESNQIFYMFLLNTVNWFIFAGYLFSCFAVDPQFLANELLQNIFSSHKQLLIKLLQYNFSSQILTLQNWSFTAIHFHNMFFLVDDMKIIAHKTKLILSKWCLLQSMAEQSNVCFLQYHPCSICPSKISPITWWLFCSWQKSFLSSHHHNSATFNWCENSSQTAKLENYKNFCNNSK